VVRGEILIELGDSWLTAKTILVVPEIKEIEGKEQTGKSNLKKMTLEGPNRRANYARDVIGIRGTPPRISHLRYSPLARRTGYGIRRDNLTKSQRGGVKIKGDRL